MTMKWRLAIGVAGVLVLAAAAWFGRGAVPVARAARMIGLQPERATPDAAATLQAAGVHKCVGAHGTSYLDGPCPAGTREVATHGGTMTVTSFPKPAPAPSSSAFGRGRPLLEPMDPDERDRLRDKAVDEAANRR